MAEDTDPRLVFIPKGELTKAKGFVDVQRNVYCLVHPEKGVVLFQIEPHRKGSLVGARLQGNSDERVTKMIRDQHYPWAQIELIESIHIPINVSDY